MSESLRRGAKGGRNAQFLMRAGVVLTFNLGITLIGRAQTPPPSDLTQFTLEDLMNVQVVSVSKKEQKLAKTGAAIFVITQEDIRRSGAANIPDVLRLVPGIDVARIDANTTAISIRGFNDRLANKVLVLIDGRTVYTPTTSGVYWDQQDVPLEDIERIEVIRGPGGTVWGANAVNGVINIITKGAKSTTGGLISASGGSAEAARGLVRYGANIGQGGAYRVFGNYSNTGSLTASDGSRGADGWHMFHGGFRSDWNLSPSDAVTVEGDLMRTREGQTIAVAFADALPLQRTFNDSVTVDSGNILGRWDHLSRKGSEASLQVYYVAFLSATDMGRILSLFMFMGATLQMNAQAPAFDEYQVKAAFLYNFAKFVEWPAGTFANSTDPIGICIVGQNPFGSTLENMVQAKKVGDRAFAVRRLTDTQQSKGCQILFISAVEWKRYRALLDALKGVSVLTVGESEDFTSLGGIIAFQLEGPRVRIQIALEPAERAKLHISSKLLSLAEIAKRQP